MVGLKMDLEQQIDTLIAKAADDYEFKGLQRFCYIAGANFLKQALLKAIEQRDSLMNDSYEDFYNQEIFTELETK